MFVKNYKQDDIYFGIYTNIVNTNENKSNSQVLSDSVFSKGQTELEIILEKLSVEELQSIESIMIEKFEERKITSPKDYYFSDGERLVLDSVRFYIKRIENQDDCIKVEDMFHSSWGYDQTNIEHYKVVELSPSGKTCKVVEIGSKTVEGSEGFMSDSVVPDPTFVHDKPALRVKIERSRDWNPIQKEHQEIGEINLRGSIYYAGEHKHLENLYRVKGSVGRSWYA